MLIVLQSCTPSCLASFLCLTLKTLLALTAGEQPVEWQKLRSVLRPAGRHRRGSPVATAVRVVSASAQSACFTAGLNEGF